MAITDIDFKKPARLLINGDEYSISTIVTLDDHVFNNAGSKMELKNVYPIALEEQEGNRLKSFKLPKFSFAELYFGDKLFNFGVVKVQNKGSLNPRNPKHIDVTVVSYKEWLSSQFMDFPIVNMSPAAVVNQVVKTMANQRIKVGTLSFENPNRIPIYNTKSKTAYDVLRMIEKHSNSIYQVKIEEDKTISINYYNQNSIKNTNNGNKGIDVIITDDISGQLFYDTYGIIDMTWAENNMKSRNFVRVESEAVISNNSQEQKIDTSQGESTVELSFKVGAIDSNKTFVTVDDGTPEGSVRKLTVVDNDGAAKGKLYDIVYDLNSTTIKLNSRLVGKQSIITITYFPLLRQSIDYQNSSDQNEVALVAGGGLGRKDQMEKYNDITNIDMLLAMAIRHGDIGTEPKTKLMIESEVPIWDLGQHTNYDDINHPDLKGEYIVREYKITIYGIDTVHGSETLKIEYSLVKSKDLENELNYYDSLAYRDNPIFDLAGATVNTTTSIDENLFMVALNLVDECAVGAEEQEFDYNLDFDFGYQGAKDGNAVWEY